MARTKKKPKVKGRFSIEKMRGVVKAKNRRAAMTTSIKRTRLPPKQGKTGKSLLPMRLKHSTSGKKKLSKRL